MLCMTLLSTFDEKGRIEGIELAWKFYERRLFRGDAEVDPRPENLKFIPGPSSSLKPANLKL